jgi:hypothetical protein
MRRSLVHLSVDFRSAERHDHNASKGNQSLNKQVGLWVSVNGTNSAEGNQQTKNHSNHNISLDELNIFTDGAVQANQLTCFFHQHGLGVCVTNWVGVTILLKTLDLADEGRLTLHFGDHVSVNKGTLTEKNHLDFLHFVRFINHHKIIIPKNPIFVKHYDKTLQAVGLLWGCKSKVLTYWDAYKGL